ncbi:hypothetical protein JCM5350_008172 [Sporobolomyces pararoseus]
MEDHNFVLTKRIDKLESDFLTSVAAGSPLSAVIHSLRELWDSTQLRIEEGIIDDSVIERLHRAIRRIHVIASDLGQLEQHATRIGADLKVRAQALLEEETTVTPTFTRNATSEQQIDPFLPLRLWFLENFSNPYPDTKQKEHFQTLYPTHSKQQLDTWFTNIRRRSGWQDLRRRFTNGTTEDFVRLCKEVDTRPRTFRAEEAAQKMEKIKMFLREGVREKVRDEIQQLVEKGAPVTNTKRTIAPRQRRTPLPVAKNNFCVSTPSKPKTQARKPSPSNYLPNYPSLPPSQDPSFFSSVLSSYSRPSSVQNNSFDFAHFKTSIVESPASVTPPRLPSQPRYPSSFSTPSPTTSLRSVSNSSSSSFDSVLSYDSNSSYGSHQAPSPPSSSSLAGYDTPSALYQSPVVHTPSRAPRRPSYARQISTPIENPYFFTLNNTPLLPLPADEADPVIATSSLAGFASNGDLVV